MMLSITSILLLNIPYDQYFNLLIRDFTERESLRGIFIPKGKNLFLRINTNIFNASQEGLG